MVNSNGALLNTNFATVNGLVQTNDFAAFTNGIQDYVLSLQVSSVDYYLTTNDAGISDADLASFMLFSLVPDESGTNRSLTYSGFTNGQYLAGWISPPGVPGSTLVHNGTYLVNVTLRNLDSNSTVVLKAEMYVVSADGQTERFEIENGTTWTLDNVQRDRQFTIVMPTNYVSQVDDRGEMKLKVVDFTGTPNVEVTVMGSTLARVSAPVSLAIFATKELVTNTVVQAVAAAGVSSTNFTRQTGLDATNYALVIGFNATNYASTLGVNGTNFGYSLQAMSSNLIYAIGLANTNYTGMASNSALVVTTNASQSASNAANAYALVLDGYLTNYALSLGANSTNYATNVSGMASNAANASALALASANTNFTLLKFGTLGTNDTNYTLTIGGYGSNYTASLSANASNAAIAQALVYDGYASNYALTIGGYATNYATNVSGTASNAANATSLAYAAANTNFTLLKVGTLGTNDTNYALTLGGYSTNYTLTIGGYATNYTLTVGGYTTNYATNVSGMASNAANAYTLAVGSSITNYVGSQSQVASNSALVVLTNFTGSASNSALVVATNASQNASNSAMAYANVTFVSNRVAVVTNSLAVGSTTTGVILTNSQAGIGVTPISGYAMTVSGSQTNTGNLQVGGTLFTTSAANGGGTSGTNMQPKGLFCSMATTTTNAVFAANGVYVPLTNYTTAITNGFVSDLATGYMTNLVAGYYVIQFGVSMFPGGNNTVACTVFVNGTAREDITSIQLGANTSPRTVHCSGIVYLAANSYVNLQVKSSSTQNNTVYRVSLTAFSP